MFGAVRLRALLLTTAGSALCCATAHAATLHVTSNGDTHQDGYLTLREAIAQSAAGDTVVFDVLWVMLTGGELQIAHDLTIDGGTRNVSVSRYVGNAPDFRIFNVLSGQVTFNNLGIDDGSAVSSGPDVSARGGGILNAGQLALNHCVFGANRASGSPGSVAVNGGTGGDAQGGALYNRGSVVLSGCTLSTAGANGGDAAQVEVAELVTEPRSTTPAL